MKCADCKFWYNDVKNNTGIANIGTCKKPMSFEDATEWANTNNLVIKDYYKDLKIFVQDVGNLGCYFFTRDDFYCAHFTAKT
jgi:hypothetical protein